CQASSVHSLSRDGILSPVTGFDRLLVITDCVWPKNRIGNSSSARARAPRPWASRWATASAAPAPEVVMPELYRHSHQWSRRSVRLTRQADRAASSFHTAGCRELHLQPDGTDEGPRLETGKMIVSS